MSTPMTEFPTPRDGLDSGSIAEADWTTALGKFTMDLGPGVVFMPGRTTTTAHTNLLQHGEDFDRRPRLDAPNSGTVATVAAAGTAQRSAGTTARWGGMFAPWAIVQGSTSGTTRTCPWSAIQAGLDPAWLNDAVKGYLSPRGEFDRFLELPHLKVFVARPEYLLAMKCAALRLGEEFHDLDDVRYLLRYLNVRTADEELAIVIR
jgi:hypothetical protein